MVRWLTTLGGVVLGGALGLFGPVLVMAKLHLGSGSYEDVLLPWLIAVPAGVLLGAWLGALLGRRLTALSTPHE